MRTPMPLFAAALALLAAAPVNAQTRPYSSAPQGGSGSYPSGSSYGGEDRTDQPERAERPEQPERGGQQDPGQDLTRQLNLRSDQQAAFRDYQSAFTAQAQDQDDGADVSRLAAMTTPQRLDDAARNMERDRADFDRVAAATRRFYATLDSTQRRTFDRITAPQADDQGDDDDNGGSAAPSSAGRR